MAAIASVLAVIYLAAANLRVGTTTTFATAGEGVPFTAVITAPPLTSPGGQVNWDFGDGTNTTISGTAVTHPYSAAGTYFVAASSSLSNGRAVDNFNALYAMYVGPSRDLTDKDSLGVIAINTSASSLGAPFIAAGGKIAAMGTAQQKPKFFMSTTPTANKWINYTWNVTGMSFNFGDGSPAQANNTANPFHIDHAYAKAGLYPMTLTVTTRNESTTETVSPSSSVGPVPVSPTQTRTTTVAQTIAVGSYKPVTYSGSVRNPGLIVVQEAVTGGYTSLDPAIDYESVGFEIIANTYQTLLWYNGTKTDQFVPVLADKIPSVADGTISSDHKNYTFHIRAGMKFSDGSAVTAWDVKYSITRTLLFVFGAPSTSGWIISQFLLPALDPSALTFANVNNAISVNNVSQTVTFHLAVAAPELLFFQVVSDPLGASVVNSKWLDTNGAKITWTSAGFTNYQKFGNLDSYNDYVRNRVNGSGPFTIDYITPGESVALKRNPYFTATPGIPAPTVERVFIQYVGEDATRELSLESGQADIATIVSSRFDAALRMQRNGLINVQFFPTLNLFWWNFNLEIAGAPNSENSVPSNFFTDLKMRQAFAYAYNYDNYINNIVGNAKFNATFAEKYGGIIPKGMIGYENLSAYDVYDLTQAKQFYANSKWVASKGGVATAGFHLTIVVETADPVNKAAAGDWKKNLEQLGPNIVIDVKEMSFTDVIKASKPHLNPMAVYFLGWLPDYPYPTDYTYPMLEPGNAASPYGGTYPGANGFNISYLAKQGETAQAATAQKISDWINATLSGPSSTDVNQVVDLSRKAQREFSNLTLYVWAQQQFAYFSYRTWITGIDLEKNPMLGGFDLLYNLLGKKGGSSASPGTASFDAEAFLASGLQASLVALVALASRMRVGAG